MNNFNIARRCGWRYEWVEALDPDIYAVVVEELIAEDRDRPPASG